METESHGVDSVLKIKKAGQRVYDFEWKDLDERLKSKFHDLPWHHSILCLNISLLSFKLNPKKEKESGKFLGKISKFSMLTGFYHLQYYIYYLVNIYILIQVVIFVALQDIENNNLACELVFFFFNTCVLVYFTWNDQACAISLFFFFLK